MTNEKPQSKVRKLLGVCVNIITYVFFALCVFALVTSVTAKKSPDGATTVLGMQMRVVVSNSMEKCDETDVSAYKIKDIPIKSMVFIETVPADAAEAEAWYSELQVGDVLTFRYVYIQQETITHRITSIAPKEGGGYIIQLAGDNKASDVDTLAQTIDTSLTDSPDYVIGKVVATNYPLGLLTTAVKSPVGIICIVIIPSLIIMIFEIFRMVNVLSEGKRRAEQEKQAARDAELEEMRRQLEALQQQQAQAAEKAAAEEENAAKDAEAAAETSSEEPAESTEEPSSAAEEAQEETSEPSDSAEENQKEA